MLTVLVKETILKPIIFIVDEFSGFKTAPQNHFDALNHHNYATDAGHDFNISATQSVDPNTTMRSNGFARAVAAA